MTHATILHFIALFCFIRHAQHGDLRPASHIDERPHAREEKPEKVQSHRRLPMKMREFHISPPKRWRDAPAAPDAYLPSFNR